MHLPPPRAIPLHMPVGMRVLRSLLPVLFLAFYAASGGFVRGQASGAVDLSFEAGSLVNSSVRAVVVQPDGKVLVGGEFTTVRGGQRNRITRLHADGSVDTSFNPGTGADDRVYSLTLQSDGKVLVGGNFTTINGMARSRIARLNADGSLDTSFDPGRGTDGEVRSLALQSDGKVLMGGIFTTINGMARSRIARLNADGTLDESFSGTGASSAVYSIALQSDGKVLMGGAFTTVNGTTRNRVARLNSDGRLDTSFDPGAGPNDWVYSLALQSDGKVLVGGDFLNFSGTIRNHIARLNADGSLDTTFTGTGTNGAVRALVMQSDGRVLIGGNFTDTNDTTRYRIARLNTNGSLDTTFSPGWGANITVNAVAVQSDGGVLVGGDFTTINDVPCKYIARLNADGSPDAAFSSGWGANNTVDAIALQPDGKVLVGGDFTSFNGTLRNRIARLNADGSLDISFNPGASGLVRSIALQGDGKVLVGGNFSAIAGAARNYIARLNANGALDTTFTGTGAGSRVNSIALQSDGKVIVGGDFGAINGIARRYIARLNADGSPDTSFAPGTGPDGNIYSLALQSDGKVLVAGTFTTINGTPRNRIARLNADGSLDTSFNPGTGASSIVYSLALQSDGKVLLGGIFTTIDGTACNRIARLNADGSLDASFNPGSGADNAVFSLVLQSDGKVLAGGAFTSFNGTARSCIARLNADGSLDAGFNPGPGASSTVLALALQSNGKVLVGGDFTTINGSAAAYLARLQNDAATQSLSVTSASRVEWLRGGTSPESDQVSFEYSIDSGTSWSVLGAGARIAGGWERTGLNLPVAGLLRATARTTGGQYNGSSGLVQMTASFFVPKAPAVSSSASASITASGAVLSGAVNPNGLVTTAYFEYGPTSAYGNTVPVTLSPADGIAAQSVSGILSGLQPATTYYYRLVATNSLGTTTTTSGTFTTRSMTKAEWRQHYFQTTLNSGVAADTADPDGDGQVNLLEFAFGTNPIVGQSGVVSFEGSGNEAVITPGRETVSVSTTSDTVNYRARFVRRKNYATEGLTYTVQFSATLSSWSNSTATPIVVADDGDLQVVEVPYPFFVNGRKAQFFRVSVTGP